MNFREAKVVARFDYRNLVRSAPGVTFLILYLYTAITLGSWLAEQLRADKYFPPNSGVSAAQAQHYMNTFLVGVVKWFLGGNSEAVNFLVFDRPIAMSAFFLFSLLLMPILVQFLSFNQVSGYVSRKSIRYIIPKTGRLELYLGLFTSNLTFFSLVSGALTAVMTVGWMLVGSEVGTGMVVGYSLRIFIAVWLSCLPIMAMMSMVAALTGSPVATVFLGAGAYGLLDIAGHFASQQTPYGEILYWILPLQVKYWFVYPGVGRFLAASALMIVYTAAFLTLGWVFLKRRNL